ncbi:MAG TPA: hypothetical protein VG916_02250, partial [Gemmatimonadaceae bacterium]|nr:hypothetical protein [Gemmatimonadaceae bacterium]
MQLRPCLLRTAALVAIVAPVALAQEPAPTGSLPPIRPLGKVTAAASELLTAVSQVRALPDGRVLVNDNGGRKVVLFDAGLTSYAVVADTTSATANAYSSRAGGLIPYKGDSTLFVDPTSLSMLVIDGRGQVARVMSVPRPNDANSLVGGPNGTPAFDAQGRLVYRASPQLRFTQNASGRAGGSGAAPTGFAMPELPDSIALVRIDLATRAVDTIAKLRITKQKMNMSQSADGRMSITPVMNPMQYVDDWAVTSDGRVAVIRGQEYRVDWIGADDKVAASQKIPFAWRHLDDSTKTAFLDSTRAAMEKLREEAQKRIQQGGGPAALGGGGGGGGGAPVMVFQTETRAAGAAPGAANGAPARGAPGG